MDYTFYLSIYPCIRDQDRLSSKGEASDCISVYKYRLGNRAESGPIISAIRTITVCDRIRLDKSSIEGEILRTSRQS